MARSGVAENRRAQLRSNHRRRRRAAVSALGEFAL